jgi:hypothetical protein
MACKENDPGSCLLKDPANATAKDCDKKVTPMR